MNILLTSAGRRTYMVQYFKNALGDSGLVHASNSIYTYTLGCADKYVITPSIYDEGYIDFLITYCKKHNISAIISLFDIDLHILAENKARFQQEGIKVIVSDMNVTKICNDKWLTYEFLVQIGVKQTPSFLNLAETEAALQSGAIKFPLIIKPRWGMGSIGVYKVCNTEELNVLYKKLHTEIFDTYLKYESAEDVDNSIIIQEIIKGQEYGIEILNDLDGNFVTCVAKKKIAMRSGETDVAEIVDNTPFLDLAKKISQSLKHVANLDVDCFVTEDGRVYVLEMNCRFGGQYPFSHNAGVDFPKQIISWLEGALTNTNYITPQVGVKSCKDLVPVTF
ncbi:MAG: ATP-grasp domain-containing protein [Bacteroidaceae bacterium]|nr:ATP-grasp domain-containing protein [Bacteroidaceae bacterium]